MEPIPAYEIRNDKSTARYDRQFCHTHRIHVWYINANIWGILMVNVTIYSIHGSYGMVLFFWKMSSTPEAGLIILGLKMWGITIRSAQIELVFVHERQIDPIHSHPLIMRNWCRNSEALEGGSKFLTRNHMYFKIQKPMAISGFYFLQRYYDFLDPKNQPLFVNRRRSSRWFLSPLGVSCFSERDTGAAATPSARKKRSLWGGPGRGSCCG